MVYKKSHFSILKMLWNLYNIDTTKAKELCNVHYAQLQQPKIVEFAKKQDPNKMAAIFHLFQTEFKKEGESL